ncbi:MAG TPA: response regulator [Stenotrophobium sp.]|jgi:two-component system response regulator BaeR|nr:response regulator [Stenotrophobium sp.]
MSAHILVVDDEIKIADLVCDYFRNAGMSAEALYRGDEVEARVARRRPDLIVLDLQLPGKDGLDICRALRARDDAPAILMLTARVDEIDRLLGLELGADDYVCKPFSPREIVARAKSILRRLQPHTASPGVVHLGRLSLHPEAHIATIDDQPLALTPIEFALLVAMVEQPSRVWSRAQLLERARGSDFAGYERNMDSHIKNLRRKLRERLGDADPIRSIYGVGYGLDSGCFN